MEGKKKNILFIILTVFLIVCLATIAVLVTIIATNKGKIDSSNTDNITSNVDSTDNSKNETKNITLSDEEAKTKIERAFVFYAEGVAFAENLYGKKIGTNEEDVVTLDNNKYYLTSIDYSEFKKEVLNFISEDVYNSKNKFKNRTICIENNSKLAILAFGATGSQYRMSKFEKELKEANKYVCKVEGFFGYGSVLSYNEVTFELNDNGNYIITNISENKLLANFAKLVERYFSASSSGKTVAEACYGEKIDTSSIRTTTIDGEKYSLTNIDYTKFMENVNKIFSDEVFKKLNEFKGIKICIESNSKLAIYNGEWQGSSYESGMTSISNIVSDSKFVMDFEGTLITAGRSQNVSYEFTFEKSGDNYVITKAENKAL